MTTLRVEGVEKRYEGINGKSDSSAVFSLKPTRLTIEKGEFFALLGPSGCGKTTLLKLVAGLLTPDRGEIFLDSDRVTPIPPENRGFGMVFQQPLLFPHMTVEENVAFGLKMQGVGKAERLRKAWRMMESVGLSGFGSRYPSQLSGGQQQRVSVARAIVSEPRILLMDEPFSALDPEIREEMRDLVGRLHKEHGVTILFVTHDREEAFLLADRVGVMKDGVVLQVGKPQELYENPDSPFVASFLGAKNVLRGELHKGWFTSKGLKVKVSVPNNGQKRSGWLILRPEVLHPVKKPMVETEIDSGSASEVYFIQGFVKHLSFRQGFHYMKVEAGSHILDVVFNAGSGENPLAAQSITLRYDVKQIRFIPEDDETERRSADA
jgi:ABC-type Fe3+/spermidine/putrescine transport system ATPase subunit